MSTLTLRRGASNGAELRIVLDRPESLNALDRELGSALRDALRGAAAHDEVRVVVLTGAGRAFSSGADLRAGFDADDEGRPAVRELLESVHHPAIEAIRDMPKPVVAAVNGPAVGIGCSLALACDLVVAAESAYLLLAFANIGLAPDGGASLLVPARAGIGRFAEMAMLAERIPAGRALEWGLVDRVVSDDAFNREVDELAERLATGPTRSYAAIKRQLNAAAYRGLREQLALEAEVQQELAGSEDFAEGVQAFLGRRPARFQGR
jgi:2-(1,2-epoxy-1,2-dihydrophenyl)acetyl-CoA isomerase